MPTQSNLLVVPERLIAPDESFRSAFPGLGFRDNFILRTSGEPVLVIDPTYLADVYHSMDSAAAFLRAHGVFIMNFGGDVSCPIWFQHPYALMPISLHRSDAGLDSPPGAVTLAQEVGTDSGSFIFLPITDALPDILRAAMRSLTQKSNGVLLPLLAGIWTIWYQQWDAPVQNHRDLYRDIVLKHEPANVSVTSG